MQRIQLLTLISNLAFAVVWTGVLLLAGLAVWNFGLQPASAAEYYEFFGILLLKLTLVTVALWFLRKSLSQAFGIERKPTKPTLSKSPSLMQLL